MKSINDFGGGKGLRLYFIGYLALMGLLLMAIFIYLFVSRERETILNANKAAGIILAENLASNSIYGFISTDKVILESILAGVKKQEGVLYAEIKEVRVNAKVLAQYGIGEYNVEEINVAPESTVGIEKMRGGSIPVYEIISPVKIVSYDLEEELMFLDRNEAGVKKENDVKIVGFVRIGWSLEKTYDKFQRDKWFIIFVTGLLIIIFSMFHYYQLTKVVINPLKHFIKGAGNVEGGNLEYRFTDMKHDEIGELMNAFNRMADSIQVQQETIVKHERLAAIGRTMASVAHEIRHGFQKILVKMEVIPTTDRDAITTLIDEILNMSEKMNSMLKYTKTEKLNLENANAQDVLDLVAHDFKNLASEKNCKLTVLYSANPIVRLDKSQMYVALANLVRNALDSGFEQLNIDLFLEERGNDIDFVVKDNGCGMDEETRERALEAFFTRKKRGYGLGLSIVETVALAHKGRVIIDSELGKGTTIKIRIPRSV